MEIKGRSQGVLHGGRGKNQRICKNSARIFRIQVLRMFLAYEAWFISWIVFHSKHSGDYKLRSFSFRSLSQDTQWKYYFTDFFGGLESLLHHSTMMPPFDSLFCVLFFPSIFSPFDEDHCNDVSKSESCFTFYSAL